MPKIYTPDISGHLLEIDKPTGDEFIAGGDELFSPQFFVDHAKDITFEQLVMQLEFEKAYSK